MQNQSDPDTVTGEAYRYLAELPWVPYAMLANTGLEWNVLDESSVEVATHVRGKRIAVRTEFNGDGDIARASTASRPRLVDGQSVSAPWGGDFGEYQTFGGIRLPSWAEVYWELPEGRYVYWRGNVTSAARLDEPFKRRTGQ